MPIALVVAASVMPKFFGNAQSLRSALPASLAPMKSLRLFLAALAALLSFSAAAAEENQNADLEKVADEYVKGWLAAHPLSATSLGFHEFDGRINDYTRLSIDAELSRLKQPDERLKKFDPGKLNAGRRPRAFRILMASVRRDLFDIQDMDSSENNPMTYARALDVNVYIKRNFAPLDDRARSVIAIENQMPNIFIAAKTNLAAVLPQPYVELAIQIAPRRGRFSRRRIWWKRSRV